MDLTFDLEEGERSKINHIKQFNHGKRLAEPQAALCEKGNKALPCVDQLEQQAEDSEMGVCEKDDGLLDLPPSRLQSTKSVPNGCAICLERYLPGDTVVWSTNIDCSHVFHQTCILSYLIKICDKDASPCPCCRQNFVIECIDIKNDL